jgi:hypothetical protein
VNLKRFSTFLSLTRCRNGGGGKNFVSLCRNKKLLITSRCRCFKWQSFASLFVSLRLVPVLSSRISSVYSHSNHGRFLLCVCVCVRLRRDFEFNKFQIKTPGIEQTRFRFHHDDYYFIYSFISMLVGKTFLLDGKAQKQQKSCRGRIEFISVCSAKNEWNKLNKNCCCCCC